MLDPDYGPEMARGNVGGRLTCPVDQNSTVV